MLIFSLGVGGAILLLGGCEDAIEKMLAMIVAQPPNARGFNDVDSMSDDGQGFTIAARAGWNQAAVWIAKHPPARSPGALLLFCTCCDTSARVASEIESYNLKENDPRIRLLQAVDKLYGRVYHNLKVVSPCRLPAKGPVILASNHISALDPVSIQSACPRLIRWMMAREYFGTPGLNWFFRTVGTILVDRNGRDMAATRAALRALEEGYVLGVFPEGRIEPSKELLPFHPGVAMLAAKSGAPVYPVYIDGTQRTKEMVAAYLWRNQSSIAFGPPVRFTNESKSVDLRAMTATIQQAVAKLQQSTYH